MRHWDLVCLMLVFRPGQKNRCLTFASIPFMPWCAAGSDSSTSARSCRGIRILLALTVTPSKQHNSSRMGQKTWIMGRRSLRDLGELFWITCTMVRHSSSVAAAAIILSYIITFSLGSLPYIDVKAALTAVSIIWVGLSCGLTGFFDSRPKVTWIPGIMVISAATEGVTLVSSLWNRSPFHSRWGTFVSPIVVVPADLVGELTPPPKYYW